MDSALKKVPYITVLMPVYNAEQYLGEAIESILNQSFSDFEFLIINDGSTDNSLKIIQSYKDSRIKLISNERNLKLIKSLNIGIENAVGEYIIRMDADDISLPHRIARLVDYMDTHPETAACGSWIEVFQEKKKSVYKPLTDPQRIKTAFLFRTELMHPSVIYRKSIIRKQNIYYNSEYLNAEDYEFFLQMSFIAPLANVKEVLLKYRFTSNNITRTADKDENSRAIVHKKIYAQALHYLGMSYDENTLNLHRFIYLNTPIETWDKLHEISNYFENLENINLVNKRYDDLALKKELSHQMFLITKKASVLGINAFFLFTKNRYFRYSEKSLYEYLKLLIKCLLKYRKPV